MDGCPVQLSLLAWRWSALGSGTFPTPSSSQLLRVSQTLWERRILQLEGPHSALLRSDAIPKTFCWNCNFWSFRDLKYHRLYPHLTKVREISVKIAVKVATEAYRSSFVSESSFYPLMLPLGRVWPQPTQNLRTLKTSSARSCTTTTTTQPFPPATPGHRLDIEEIDANYKVPSHLCFRRPLLNFPSERNVTLC